MMSDFERQRLIPLDPNRLQDRLVTRHLPDGTRFSVERIRQMTGVGRIELDGILGDPFLQPTPQSLMVDPAQDALTDHDDSEKPEFLAPDHIVFYKPGELPVFDGGREDFYALLKSSPITLILNICHDSPIPNAWISALEGLKQQYPVFNFVRLQDIEATHSHAMVYIDGSLQNEGISISHSRKICLSDEALIRLIEPIILNHSAKPHEINRFVAMRLEGVLSRSPSIRVNLPMYAPRPPRRVDPIDLIEAEWAKKIPF